MKLHLRALALSVLVTVPTLVTADSFKRTSKEADFVAQVVGRTLVFVHGTAIVRANGKTDGKLKQTGKYHGAWVWRGGYYCRNLVISGKETGTNCQKVEIDGNKLRMTLDKGKGRVTDLVIK